MTDTSSPPPLSLADDEPAVQVLRLVRSLLMQAERLSVSEDSLARMGTILVAQTAIETLLRCAWERLTDKSNDDAKMVDVESLVVGKLKPYGLKDRHKAKALRNCRNAVAHDGTVPSSEDARAFAATLVAVAWGVDLEKLYVTSLVENQKWRRWLECAYALLDDPSYELVDDAGNNIGVFESGYRHVLAVALAHWAREACNTNVLWPAIDEAPKLYTHLEYGQREQQDLQRNHRQSEQALQFDVLAPVLGIRQADVRRFLRVKEAAITMNPFGKWFITFHGSSPDEPDARFAVEFATDWVLRAQQHVR